MNTKAKDGRGKQMTHSPNLIIAAFVSSTLMAWTASETPCFASYHTMQIEKIVAGVNGDATAQAIQLRMRFAGQGQLDNAKLVAWDAGGKNPVVVIDFQGTVPNRAAGGRILITSLQMAAYADPSVATDFTMEGLIPESYLAAGSLTFENDEETLLAWRVSWGGTGYTGPTIGALINDDDREFGPPFAGPLPTTGLQVLEFTEPFDAKSTSNVADYQLSDGPGVLINNSGGFFSLIVPDCYDPKGAGPDSDNDSVRDACDECPDDGNKVVSGICGCNASDADTDSNGTPDCLDPDQGDELPDGGNDNGDTEPDNTNQNANDNVGGSVGDSPSPRGCTPGIGAVLVGMLGLTGLRCLTAPRRIRHRAKK